MRDKKWRNFFIEIKIKITYFTRTENIFKSEYIIFSLIHKWRKMPTKPKVQEAVLLTSFSYLKKILVLLFFRIQWRSVHIKPSWICPLNLMLDIIGRLWPARVRLPPFSMHLMRFLFQRKSQKTILMNFFFF